VPIEAASVAGRRLTIYLPPGHETETAAPYPILILNDGQNLFDPDRSHIPGQPWRVAEAADDLIEAGTIPPLVICGVDHSGPGRLREFTPTPGPRREGGDADEYAYLVLHQILPFIRTRVPLSTDRRAIGIGGSSLGGLVALWMGIAYGDVFGVVLAMSPSIWWDDRYLLRLLEREPDGLVQTRVWLDIGRREGGRAASDARRLRQVLERRGTEAFKYVEDPAGDHSERSWARRLPDALEFLFGKKKKGERRVSSPFPNDPSEVPD
jgi:enterochelin esterase-like enzyme